ncbi:MAG TPA: glutaredoxin family protein [Actinomycetota bacterium]|nr:glutaredoxin family protein [Actinomycetota bacterium]
MEPVTIYSTTWCGHCRRLKRQLDEAGIGYREIDIDEHEQYADRIVTATGGYRTVPTLQIGERLLVNPTVPEVRDALAAPAAT